MQPLRRTPSNPALLACVTEDSATAALRLIAELCRQLPALKEWLWEEFARSATVRDAFARLIREPAAPLDGFASLAGEDRAWQAERQRLRQQGAAPGIYGGLSWPEMERLFRRYEAGTLDLGTFLLAHQWQAARATGKISPELVLASATFLDVVTRGGDRRLLRHYYRALSFLRAYADVPQRRRAVGYSEWWKLRVLMFMLRNPRESYRTRDLRAHLLGLGVEVSSLDLRRFCTRHGIRRDVRAGRPRTRFAAGAGVV